MKALFYGLESHNELIARNIVSTEQGTQFDCWYHGLLLGTFYIPMYGTHNVLNALAVIGMSIVNGQDLELVKKAMGTFRGVKRRFEERFWRDNIIIDDYAHHPTEITATIEAVRAKYPDRKVVAIFQPHTHSRFQKFLHSFADSLSLADEVKLLPIYGSEREQHIEPADIQDLVSLIAGSRLYDEESIKSYHDTVLLFMGGAVVDKYIFSLINAE